LLSASERQRWDAIRRPERRAQFFAGHLLLRRLVGDVAGAPAATVSLQMEADGRPRLASPPGWNVSLAHSGRWVAALVDAGVHAVGVDIELRKQRDIGAIVQAAYGVYAASPDEAYAMWAQHEAEFKAGPEAARATATWVASFDDHALAVCARATPRVAIVRLDDEGPSRPVDIAWSCRVALDSSPGR
jgi:4'-phosphopantetheinyl transferase EntD